jgi:hypothetical protein
VFLVINKRGVSVNGLAQPMAELVHFQRDDEEKQSYRMVIKVPGYSEYINRFSGTGYNPAMFQLWEVWNIQESGSVIAAEGRKLTEWDVRPKPQAIDKVQQVKRRLWKQETKA